MANDNALPHASQLASRHFDPAIPRAAGFTSSSYASRSTSDFAAGSKILWQNPNSTAAIEEIVPFGRFEQVPMAELSAERENRGHCNITGPAELDACEKNSSTISSILPDEADIGEQCSNVGNTPVVAKSDGISSIDRNKIRWRSDKKKKDTVSAALLIALGVAGIVLGS